jgi:hypothetical protein
MRSIAELNRSVSLDGAVGDARKFVKLLAQSGGRLDVARQLAAQCPSVRVREIFEKDLVVNFKAAVTVSGLSDALAPYQPLAEGFFASMAPFSALSRIYNANDFDVIPLRSQAAAITLAPVGATPNEGASKAVSSATFGGLRLEPLKAVGQFVVSNELARSISPAAQTKLFYELQRCASIQVDAKFLSILASTPGMTTAASTGVTSTAILADLTGRLTALTIGADSRLWWIVPPKLFKQLSLVQGTGGFLLQGGKIGSISVAPSDAATTVATLIDAKQVAMGLETAVLSSSSETSVEMADNPTSGDYHLVSMFQNNSTLLRAEIWFGAIAERSTAVTTLTGYS